MGAQAYSTSASPKPWPAPIHGQRSLPSTFKGRRALVALAMVVGTVWYLQLGAANPADIINSIKVQTHRQATQQHPLIAQVSELTLPKPIKSTTPMPKFRDNLLDDYRYIYANHAFGLSNQFIELCKVVAMGARMDRTPIFDNMHPEHDEGSSPLVSELFDFIPAVNRLNLSLVEWADLKTTDPDLAEAEELSGWAAFGPYVMGGGLDSYNISTHFWPIPEVMAFYPTMSTIELLGQRPPWDWIEENGERLWEERGEPVPAPPDEVVLTLDQTFFVREARIQQGRVEFWESLEHIDPDSFTWKEVGQHVRFQPWVERLATDFLAALFAAKDADPDPDAPAATPTAAPGVGGFIGVHLRQGDFGDRAVGEAGLPESFHAAVLEVQEELAAKFGAEVAGALPVVFATDAEDPGWIRTVEEAYGWVFLDHSVWDREDGHKHAGWLPGVLDSCVLGRGLGMVGTHMSTFSSVAARRVESWQGGVTRKVDPKEHATELAEADQSAEEGEEGEEDEI